MLSLNSSAAMMEVNLTFLVGSLGDKKVSGETTPGSTAKNDLQARGRTLLVRKGYLRATAVKCDLERSRGNNMRKKDHYFISTQDNGTASRGVSSLGRSEPELWKLNAGAGMRVPKSTVSTTGRGVLGTVPSSSRVQDCGSASLTKRKRMDRCVDGTDDPECTESAKRMDSMKCLDETDRNGAF